MDRPGLIAVADDDHDLLAMVTMELTACGFDTVTADEGSSALRIVHERLPDLLLLDLVMPHVDGFEVARRLGHDVRTRNIPIMAITGHTMPASRLSELLGRIDDFLEKPFGLDELIARVTLCLDRSRRMRGSNPLTQLPGNVQIQQEIIACVRSNKPFALLHIDLDEFKAFNDRYGFLRGDEAIQLLARCCSEAMERADKDGFLGHVGGDDFAAVVAADEAETIAARITQSWDEGTSLLYDKADAALGFIETVDRRGLPQRVPLMTVSIGIATSSRRPLTSHWEASEIAAEMKHVAKAKSGSAIAIDRRRTIDLTETATATV